MTLLIYLPEPHLMHVLREEVNAGHTGGDAPYADSPGQAVDCQSPQLLTHSDLVLFMTHFC